MRSLTHEGYLVQDRILLHAPFSGIDNERRIYNSLKYFEDREPMGVKILLDPLVELVSVMLTTIGRPFQEDRQRVISFHELLTAKACGKDEDQIGKIINELKNEF